jgi:hypothetical protein
VSVQEARQAEVEAAVLLDRAFLHLPEGIGSQASRDLVRLIVDAAVLRMEAAVTSKDYAGAP